MSYTISEEYGVQVVRGEVPISAFAELSERFPGTIIDPHLSTRLQANLVFGTPAACEAARRQLDAEAPSSEVLDAEGKLRHWLQYGEVGASSQVMAYTALRQHDQIVSRHHPHDPGDFRRCALLVDKVPAVREHFAAIAELTPYWRAVIEHWEEWAALLEASVPNWRRPKYELPKDAQSPVLYQAMRHTFANIVQDTTPTP